MRKLSLVAAMALGGLVAFSMLATAQEASKDAKKGMRGPSVEQLKKDLDLKDDQVTKLKPVLEDRQKKMQELRSDTSLDQQQKRDKMRSITEESNKKMKEILTEEQYKKYQEMSPWGGKKKKKAE